MLKTFASWVFMAPAPKGEFIPMLRMYWPIEKAPSLLDGTWTPPRIEKAS